MSCGARYWAWRLLPLTGFDRMTEQVTDRAVLARPFGLRVATMRRAALLGSIALLASMTSAEEPEDWVPPKANLAVGMRRAMEAERARAEGRRIGHQHTYGNPCVFRMIQPRAFQHRSATSLTRCACLAAGTAKTQTGERMSTLSSLQKAEAANEKIRDCATGCTPV